MNSLVSIDIREISPAEVVDDGASASPMDDPSGRWLVEDRMLGQGFDWCKNRSPANYCCQDSGRIQESAVLASRGRPYP